MKKLLFLSLLIPFFSVAQWGQLGSDIDGDAAGDSFGRSIALNASGTTMVAGAWQNQTNGEFSGQTKVLDYNGSAWVQRGEDIFGIGANEWSGYEVSISANGNTIATTSLVASNSAGIESAGYVRIFDWNGTAWVQRGANIEGDGEQPIAFAQFFGFSTDLSDDGNIIAIGAPNVHGPAGPNYGLVRIFEWSGSAWIQRGADINGLVKSEYLGTAVSISANGTVVAIGVPGEDVFSTNTNGEVRIFEWNGTAWNQRGNAIEGLVAGDSFGKAISINADGSVIAAGAPDFVVTTGNLTCTARVFQWNGSVWIQRGETFSGEQDVDSFGSDVSLNGNGTLFAVSSTDFFTNGNTYIYLWNGTTWVQQGATIVGEAQGDQAGASLSFNESGNTIAIGALGNDANGLGTGHVRIFKNPTILNIAEVSSITVRYYPNPTKDFITINASEVINQITVYSILGQKLLSISGNTKELTIDLTQQAAGNYFAKIETTTSTQTIKLIKN